MGGDFASGSKMLPISVAGENTVLRIKGTRSDDSVVVSGTGLYGTVKVAGGHGLPLATYPLYDPNALPKVGAAPNVEALQVYATQGLPVIVGGNNGTPLTQMGPFVSSGAGPRALFSDTQYRSMLASSPFLTERGEDAAGTGYAGVPDVFYKALGNHRTQYVSPGGWYTPTPRRISDPDFAIVERPPERKSPSPMP